MKRTHNMDPAYASTGNTLLEFFSKAGSLFTKKGTFYGDESSALELFRPAWVSNNECSMKLAMWLRDCRGGAGNRSGFREVINWIGKEEPKWIKVNMHLVPEYGRWDDLRALIGTPCEQEAMEYWANAIQKGDGLAAKWAPRGNKRNRNGDNREVFNKLRRILGMGPKDFRKLIVKNTDVVETRMCQDKWYSVEYSKVPSVAVARYNNAFGKHDTARYQEWKTALKDPESEEKVNAAVLFPHDCIRTLIAEIGDGYDGFTRFTRPSRRKKFEDSELANAQFAALPSYMEGTNAKIMAICDFSGSMNVPVSGNIKAIDVSMSLGLYCSDRLGKENPFYRKFIPFSSTSKLVCWEKDTFSVAVQKHNDGWVGSTNIEKALDQILQAAQMFGATNDQIPNMLLIISDMQFDEGTTCGSHSRGLTAVERRLSLWEDAGYSRPLIVYWNVGGYKTSPSTAASKDVVLVSGFSPSLLKAILGGEDFSPMAVLERAIEKYEVVVPE